MKRLVAVIITIIMVITFAACGMKSDDLGTNEYYEGGSFTPAASVGVDVAGGIGATINRVKAYESGEGIAYDSEEGGEYYGEEAGENEEPIQAGQITAKAWNDNEHYEQFLKLFADKTDNDPEGKFHYYNTYTWHYDVSKRVKVTVTEGDKAVVGAEVTCFDADQNKCIVKTDVSGVAYIFPQTDAGSVTVKSGEGTASDTFTAEKREITFDLAESRAQANVIKLMFVIDATGSMGDEMRYIEAELADVVHRVASQAEQVRIDLAILFYRDDGDQEKFAYHNFKTVTEEAGLNAQVTVLSRQRAEGGGDLPEAVDEALVLAAGKDWGEENSTKLMFLVLDAPPHNTDEDRVNIKNAVTAAAAKGIRICPVLCSGADDLCEYVTRMSALVTGGTSVFVTDDSGIGGAHLDPDLPEATVERLNDLMVRLIVGYHTGDFGTPVAWNADAEAGAQGGEEAALATDRSAT